MKNTFLNLIISLLLFSSSAIAEVYTLDEFIKQVEGNSKDLKLAAQELKVAKANKKEALSLALPKIMAQGTYNRNLTDMFMYLDFPIPIEGFEGESKFKVNRKNEFGFQTILSQTIFSFTIGNALTAAKQYEKLTNFMYQASYAQIMTVAKKSFYQTLLLKQVWEISLASQNNAEENYQSVKNKFDNGLVSEFELLRSEVRWKDQIPNTTQAKRNYELAIEIVKNLAGIPVDENVILDGDFTHYPSLPDSTGLESILGRRPDYNALIWEKKLRNTNIKVQKAGFYPTVSGNLIYNFSSQSDIWHFDRRNSVWMAGLTLSIPIFTGGYLNAQVQKAEIDLQKTGIRIEKSREDIYKEIKSIHLRLNEAQGRIQSAETTKKAAQKAFQIAENTAKSGLATQLDLKDARIALDQATLSYYIAVLDYLSAYFDWEYAVGNIG